MEKFTKQQKFEAIFREASIPQKKSNTIVNPNFTPQPFLSNFSTHQSEYKPKEKNAQIHFIENHLEMNKFFSGNEFSAADIQMIFGVQAGNISTPEFIGQKTKEWLAAMESRPAYKVALEKGGPFSPI